MWLGAGPHEIERRRRKLAKNGKKATRIFGVLGVFLPYFFRQRHCGTIQRYGGLREGLRDSLVAWARGVKGLTRGGHPSTARVRFDRIGIASITRLLAGPPTVARTTAI